jgi:hypothetical protein
LVKSEKVWLSKKVGSTWTEGVDSYTLRFCWYPTFTMQKKNIVNRGIWGFFSNMKYQMRERSGLFVYYSYCTTCFLLSESYIRYHVYPGSPRVVYLVSTWDRMVARFAVLGVVTHAHGHGTPRGYIRCWAMPIHMEVCSHQNISLESPTHINRWSRFISNGQGASLRGNKRKPLPPLVALWDKQEPSQECGC